MRINICSILLNDSKEERQTISYDTKDHMLYSTAEEEPLLEGETCKSYSDAIHDCDLMWNSPAWDFEWIENDDLFDSLIGKTYEDPEGVFRIDEWNADEATVTCVQDGNPNNGKQFVVCIDEALYYLDGGK